MGPPVAALPIKTWPLWQKRLLLTSLYNWLHLKHVQNTPNSKTGGKYSNHFLNTLEHRDYYTCMYHQFNLQQFYVLPTQFIYMLCVNLRINCDYFNTKIIKYLSSNTSCFIVCEATCFGPYMTIMRPICESSK